MISKKGFSTSLFTGILIWLTIPAFAQSTRYCDYIRPHEADKWVFGEKGGIDFTASPTQSDPTPGKYEVSVGISTYADKNGQLVCFSNGQEVYNGGYYHMTNGTNLIGNPYATMSSIIVPNPGNSKQLFIFTLDMYLPPVYTEGVNFSTVDFTSNPSGEVINKNVLLFNENAQKICAVMHQNQRDYWVILHGFGDNNGDSFFTYLVDTGGVNPTPIVSKVGYLQTGDFNNSGGYMKASPNGNKIALVVPDNGVVELFDFNKSTGLLSGSISSVPGEIIYPYGVEFSPDNSKLYISTSPKDPGTNYLYQFDITSSDPFNTPFTVIDQFNWSNIGSNDSLMGAVQLAPDGKIYVSKFLKGASGGKPTLSVIYNPNRPGSACNYNTLDHLTNTPFSLNGAGSLIGLPTFITDYLNIPHFSFFNKCHHDTTDFQIRNTANVEATWNFDVIDPSGTLVYTDPLNPGFVFSEPGNYQVEFTESWDGISIPFSRGVTIHPLPGVDIGNGADTISILPNSSIRLDAGEYDYYSWTPGGSHDRYLDVAQQGLYSVLVTDTNCCSNTDQVYIQFAELSFPNAFNPNSSIAENQQFGVIGDISSLAEFRFQIFDRWGLIIFETNDPTQKWDGKFKGGEMAPYGIYVWHSIFTTFESSLQAAKEIENRGTVMLLR
ncbi:MAG: hypothetical protein COW63_12530 [Bacteroidetes bacterium CG18_big_fil_WC_8_21_14_2_50_41_14]|nr:MAG: hypothetical protein COW63_12530 [Bacteroidetes bacterium CG18_big_fil_WC_8_21_14_2_50_41_14]PJB59583.1 MAG: hypothetical protein CO098_02640 [Bacteroidetes bacterium CG_4_9_14_3_um_filter_41_19]